LFNGPSAAVRPAKGAVCQRMVGVVTKIVVPSSATIGSVDRAATVLKLFVESPGPSLGVSEIATALSLSKAAVHRMLSSLREADFLELDESTRRYQLGPGALSLGLAYLDRIDVRTMALPVLSRLTELTGETATLSVRHTDRRVYVEQAFPATEIRMIVPIGQLYPLHAGSSSKAFLAFLSDAEQDQYLMDRDLESFTDRTIVSIPALRRDLAAIRSRGYAKSLGERQAGAASVAAPVFNHESKPVAVISVCGPIERFRGASDAHAQHLLDQTRDLSRRLGLR
jgi:IclR family acetate operon transcriptional repressor